MIIFDSNIWIAVFDKEDATHKQATRLFYNSAGQSVAITDFIIAEVCTVLKNNKHFDLAEAFLLQIEKEQIQILHSVVYLKSFIQTFRASGRNKLSFVDTSLLALAKEGNTILTLDKALDRQLKKL